MKHREVFESYIKNLSPEQKRAELARYRDLEETLAKDRQCEEAFDAVQQRFLYSHAKHVMLTGVNKGGKTTVLLHWCEDAATGLYAEDYKGVRFKHPTEGAICGVRNETIRDNIIERLLGATHNRGSGIIPSRCVIDDHDHIVPKRGCYGLVDFCLIPWHTPDGQFSGEYSRIFFWPYGTGEGNVQSYNLDWIGIDEECPYRWYREMTARVFRKLGYIRIAETPLLGASDLWMLFHDDKGTKREQIIYTIDECEHMNDETKEEAHALMGDAMDSSARLYGRPTVGIGLIFSVANVQILCTPFELGDHWPRIIGLDVNHTLGDKSVFAAVLLVHDVDTDTVYVVSEYKVTQKDRPVHACAVIAMGGGLIPCAWPHDGARGDELRGGGTIAQSYKKLGMRMLDRPAAPLNTRGKEERAGSLGWWIRDAQERMATGRFKVFSNCQQIMEEKCNYRHEDGIPKLNQDDHLLDAMGKALMSLRHARPISGMRSKRATMRAAVGEYDVFEL